VFFCNLVVLTPFRVVLMPGCAEPWTKPFFLVQKLVAFGIHPPELKFHRRMSDQWDEIFDHLPVQKVRDGLF
jgi:hypothetical protein